MVDTVKILLPIHDPRTISSGAFSPYSVEQLVRARGEGVTTLNPSLSYKRLGRYMPSLTLLKRPTKGVGITYTLAVEFSAPKMLFGNNFDELTDDNLEELLLAIQSSLLELLGYQFSAEELAQANVANWHPSKNVVFTSYISCHTVLNTIIKLDIAKRYVPSKTDFFPGYAVRIHCNSVERVFYNKVTDLREAVISNKRAISRDTITPRNELEILTAQKELEVLRYEVRLTGKKAVKRAYPELSSWTLGSMFKTELCQKVLCNHWQQTTASLDMLGLDVSKPHELLQNYIENNPNATPQSVLMATAGLLVVNQVGVRDLRTTLERRYGVQVWQRLKPLLKTPKGQRYRAFVQVDETLKEFKPTRVTAYVEGIAKNSN